MKRFVDRWWPLLPLLLFTCHDWFGPDQWYHLAWGREIWRSGHAIPRPHVLIAQPVAANVYWFYQLISYAIYSLGGPLLISASYILIWLTIAGVWARTAKYDGRTSLGALGLLVLTFGVQLRLEYRPEVLSYLAFVSCIFLFMRGRETSRDLLVLFGVQVLWANMHAYFVLGPPVALLYALARVLEKRSARFGVFASVGMLVATCLTPNGGGAWLTVWAYRGILSQFKNGIEELQPTFNYAWWYWPMPLFWLTLGGVVLLASIQIVRRQSVFPAFVALLGSALSLIAFRNVPFLVLSAAPLYAVALLEFRTRARSSTPRIVKGALVVLTFALSFAIVEGSYYRTLGSTTAFGLKINNTEYPKEAAEFLRQQGFKGRIFADTSDGGYLEFNLPESIVLGDSYFADPQLTQLLFESRNNAQIFGALNERLHFDAAVINVANADLLAHVREQSAWTLAHADSQRLVFFNRAVTKRR